jgi:hypothetical protein
LYAVDSVNPHDSLSHLGACQINDTQGGDHHYSGTMLNLAFSPRNVCPFDYGKNDSQSEDRFASVNSLLSEMDFAIVEEVCQNLSLVCTFLH